MMRVPLRPFIHDDIIGEHDAVPSYVMGPTEQEPYMSALKSKSDGIYMGI